MSVSTVVSKVQRILLDEFGSADMVDDGVFRLRNDSAVGFVRVREWHDSVIVKIWSPILRDVILTPELFEWVATEGQDRFFSHARVIRDDSDDSMGMIVWENDLLGDFIDPAELRGVVISVMVGANALDDELQDRFGGVKAID
jgi:hypothetical protein